MKCVHCDEEFTDNSLQFCPKCGKELREKRACTSCGQKLDDEAKFCSNCGTPLKQAGNGEAGQDKAAEIDGTINSPTPSSIVLPDMVEDSIEVNDAVISSDGKYLVMRDRNGDKDLQILDTQAGNILSHISTNESGDLMSISSDGNYVVIYKAGDKGQAKIVSTQTDDETDINYGGYLSGFRFSGDNKRLAYANALVLRHNEYVFALGHNMHAIAPVLGHPRLNIISVPKGNELLSLPISDDYKGFAFSPDGRYLVIGSYNAFSLWDARNGNEICKLVTTADDESAFSAAFSSDSTKIVALSQGCTRIWDVGSHDMLIQLEKPSISVRFSPDGKAVIAGFGDGTIQIINAESGEILRQLRSGNSRVAWASYTPDGKKLITYADNKVKFWVSE